MGNTVQSGKNRGNITHLYCEWYINQYKYRAFLSINQMF